METEHEYEEWFEKYLGNFELMYEDNKNNIFWYCPKRFSFNIWFMGLVISIGIFLVGAIILDFKGLSFLSNLSLSISTGSLINLIFLIMTNSKEKYINYYSNLIPILEKRKEQLREAYDMSWPQMSIAYQKNDMQTWYSYWHRLVNMAFVAVQFYEFLEERLSNEHKIKKTHKLNLDILTELNNDAFNLCINNDKKIEFKKLNDECSKELNIIFSIIMSLDLLIEKLNLNLFNKTYK